MTALMTVASWRKRAACRGVDPEVFYPVTDEEAGVAKAICSTCPVREACLEHALSAREREGSWGGATERERRPKPERRRQVDPTTCERDYTEEEIAFMKAMDQYKRDNRRPFPTWSEVLEVLRALGYRKVAEQTQMPGLSNTMPPKVEA